MCLMNLYSLPLIKWYKKMGKRKKHHITDLSAELTRLGNRGVRKAQDENRRLGIPNVYCKYGKIYYQLPNGEITTEKPRVLPQQ